MRARSGRWSKMVRPHVAIVTLIAAAHLGHFHRPRRDRAAPRRRSSKASSRAARRCINRDDPRWKLLDRLARAAGVEHVVGFGEHAAADLQADQSARCMPIIRSIIGAGSAARKSTARIGAPGRHIVQNALAVLGAAAAGRRRRRQGGAVACRPDAPKPGRGKRHVLTHPERRDHADRRELQRQSGLDAGGARAARRHAGRGRRAAHRRARRHAGTRRAIRPSCMPALAELITGTSTDLVLLAGPEMKSLAEALPATCRKSSTAQTSTS